MKTFNPKEFTSGALAKVDITGGYDDVKFEGVLCSTINENNGEVGYFTVDPTGKALMSFTQAGPKVLQFGLVMQDTKPVIETMANGKPRFVEVVRFFRTWDYYNDQINNFGGMTAICVMDYKFKTVTVYPSFCHPEDNFSKILGLMAAKNNQVAGKGFIINMTSANATLRTNVESGFFNKTLVWLNTASVRAFANPLARFIND